ncbi:hypothetical protein WR25_13868 [Diploscapter pachys]|uniref:Pentacotripeptide-repeat region of PRORP domain-containing protein n=1 Tax=Diploscapter pachys TaxID=2018661 RepID=A0A2A2KY31_9BILA|nr:hypothetical protein WR25_13868 [Diploscapter pachys]
MLRLCSRCLLTGRGILSIAVTTQNGQIQRPRLFLTRSALLTTLPTEEEDAALINYDDFRGITPTAIPQRRRQNPETTLTYIYQFLETNNRVTGEQILFDIIREIEQGSAPLIAALRNSPNRWIPMLIGACGAPMSIVPMQTRAVLMDRLWRQLRDRSLPITISTCNYRLKVMLENEIKFDPNFELKKLETKMKLDPNEDTFLYLLQQTATVGTQNSMQDMTYAMASRGFQVKSREYAAIIYSHALKGIYDKAESLVKQAMDKYGSEGHAEACGALVRGTAARGDMDKLRNFLRSSINLDNKKLVLNQSDIFETIWHLAKRHKAGETQTIELIEQILEYSNRKRGFFRSLVRAIEQHVTHGYYYTAIALLEETTRVAECIINQKRDAFIPQVLSRMSRQLIREEVSIEKVKDIANRVTTTFQAHKIKVYIYHDLLWASLMMKKFNNDQKLAYLTVFVEVMDRKRNRPHVILPLIAGVNTLTERLQILYRARNLGYKDISQLDVRFMIINILQPLYDSTRLSETQKARGMTKLDRMERSIASYGCDERSIWSLFFKWWEIKDHDERIEYKKRGPNQVDKIWPPALHLRTWLKKRYSEIFVEEEEDKITKKTTLTYEKLKCYILNEDSTTIHSYLTSYGWPEGTNFNEIASKLLKLYLEGQPWQNVHWLLSELSSRTNSNLVTNSDPDSSPLANYDLLRVLRRCIESSNPFSIRDVIDLCYELRTMFPNAVASYENFFETQHEYNRFYSKFFDKNPQAKIEAIDDGFELIRTLVNLAFIQFHANETLSIMFVGFVLRKVGWEHAVATWMRFQSHLHLSNGLVALIRHCIHTQHEPNTHDNLQYVLHKAQNFISQSRAICLHLITLITYHKIDDARRHFEEQKDLIDPSDCVLAMRLMNTIKLRETDEAAILAFSEMSLEIIDKEQGLVILKDLLRLCETKKLGMFALQLADLYASHGIELSDDEKKKLCELVGGNEQFERDWIFQPNGLLRLSEDDEINTDDEISKYKRKLLDELGETQRRATN